MQGIEAFPKELVVKLVGNQTMGPAEGEGPVRVTAIVE